MIPPTARTPDRPFRDLCPEADLRDAMDDGEFWEHVLLGPEAIAQHAADVAEGEDYEPDDLLDLTPCPVCGERGACAYDADGNSLIHVIPDDDETEFA